MFRQVHFYMLWLDVYFVWNSNCTCGDCNCVCGVVFVWVMHVYLGGVCLYLCGDCNSVGDICIYACACTNILWRYSSLQA